MRSDRPPLEDDQRYKLPAGAYIIPSCVGMCDLLAERSKQTCRKAAGVLSKTVRISCYHDIEEL